MRQIPKKIFVILIILLILFIINTIYIVLNEQNNYDLNIMNYFYDMRSSGLTNLFLIITNLCNAIIIILICIGSIIVYKLRYPGILIALNGAFSYGINFIVKLIFTRERPDIEHLVSESTYSYPSGHSTIAMSFYLFLLFVIFQNKKIKKSYKIAIYIITLVLISLIGISRMYLGVHYLSDILSGFILGGIICIFFMCAYYFITNKKIIDQKIQ